MKEIVRLYHLDLHIHTNVKAASQIENRKVDLDVDRNHLNIKHVTSEDHKFRIQSSNANSQRRKGSRIRQ
jgi:hypothetical protein